MSGCPQGLATCEEERTWPMHARPRHRRVCCGSSCPSCSLLTSCSSCTQAKAAELMLPVPSECRSPQHGDHKPLELPRPSGRRHGCGFFFVHVAHDVGLAALGRPIPHQVKRNSNLTKLRMLEWGELKNNCSRQAVQETLQE